MGREGVEGERKSKSGREKRGEERRRGEGEKKRRGREEEEREREEGGERYFYPVLIKTKSIAEGRDRKREGVREKRCVILL
jgi:hypothetical protein